MLHDNRPKYSMDAIWNILFDYARSDKWINSHKKEISDAIVQNLNYRPNMSYDWRWNNVGAMSVRTLLEMCDVCDADAELRSEITGQVFSAISTMNKTGCGCSIRDFVQTISYFGFGLYVNGIKIDLFGDFVNMVQGGRRKVK